MIPNFLVTLELVDDPTEVVRLSSTYRVELHDHVACGR